MKKLIAISGATGIGKTEMAIRLADHFKTEIISADSRQFFAEMNIGVAKPSSDELLRAKHHFIGHVSIFDEYSAGKFEREALDVLDEIFSKNDVAICVGGSGLYLNALIHGLDDLPSDRSVKEKFAEILENEGIEKLQELLKQQDPDYFIVVDIHNPHRLIRALEVIELTGEKYSTIRTNESKQRNFEVIIFVLSAQRSFIYDRINRRVDIMVEQGLIEEVRGLTQYQHLNALNTVGYKEFFEIWKNNGSEEEAIELVKQHSRNYAKRQETWWKRTESAKWIMVDQQEDPFEKILASLG
jgi:tRNA dimethylallyltransferase